MRLRSSLVSVADCVEVPWGRLPTCPKYGYSGRLATYPKHGYSGRLATCPTIFRNRNNSASSRRSRLHRRPSGRRGGYTLVEILVALTLTLILMTAVVTVFGGVGEGIAKSRRSMEQFDRLRAAAQQLRIDLQGLTVTLDGRPVLPRGGARVF